MLITTDPSNKHGSTRQSIRGHGISIVAYALKCVSIDWAAAGHSSMNQITVTMKNPSKKYGTLRHHLFPSNMYHLFLSTIIWTVNSSCNYQSQKSQHPKSATSSLIHWPFPCLWLKFLGTSVAIHLFHQLSKPFQVISAHQPGLFAPDLAVWMRLPCLAVFSMLSLTPLAAQFWKLWDDNIHHLPGMNRFGGGYVQSVEEFPGGGYDGEWPWCVLFDDDGINGRRIAWCLMVK